MLLFPIGWWWCPEISKLKSPERLQNGCVFILPGIQGKSPIEFEVAHGLTDAGVDLAIEIFDWTTGFWSLFLYHLRASSRHRRMASRLCERIIEYQQRFPGKPVYLIGHSGGGAVALMTAQELPPDRKVAGLLLLAPAISTSYDYQPALDKTEYGIWNFYSPLDAIFLIVGTILCGTIDGKMSWSAGAVGFRTRSAVSKNPPSLHQVCFSPKMILSGNFGGHFGPVNRLFVAEFLAPVIQDRQGRAQSSNENG